MNGYIKAADIAHIYGITLNHVYVLACTKRWRRIRTGDGYVRYLIYDVANALGDKDTTDTQAMP